MVGKTVESRPETPVAAITWSMIGLAFFGLAGLVGHPGWAVVGLAALVLAFFLFLARMPAVTFRFTEAGIQVEKPTQEFIGYDSIHTLRPSGRSHDFRKPPRREAFILNIVHENGVLSLPRSLTVPSEDVLQFIDSCLPTRADSDLPRALARHHDQQVSRYGEERVTAYSTRPHLGYLTSYPWRYVGIGLTLAYGVLVASGIVLITNATTRKEEGWGALVPIGIVLWFLSMLILWALWAGRSQGPARTLRNWKSSGLVISPEGIGLVQGDLKGEMAWEEIRDAVLDVRTQGGIVLKVEGARILIADIYRAPVSHILNTIRDNWRGDHGD